MAGFESLLEQGFTLPGTPRRSINTDTGKVGYEDTSTVGILAKSLQAFLSQQEQIEEKRQKELQRKSDMYKTLREAGYDPQRAYDAVIKGKMPEGPSDDRIIPKTQREKILDKLARGEKLTEGEQTVYDETIKHKESEDDLGSALNPKPTKEKVVTSNKEKLKEKILNKIAAGEILTPGEQKIYDEVIKKSQKPESELDATLKDKDKTKDEMILVISPDGKKGKIPKSKLAAALKAGYKKR